MSFLLECLEDLDSQLKEEGGRLNMVLGKPLEVFAILIKHFDIVRVCFDQDSEACWLERDNGLKNFCMKYRIQVKIGASSIFSRWLRALAPHCGILWRSSKQTEASHLSLTRNSVTSQRQLASLRNLVLTLTSLRWSSSTWPPFSFFLLPFTCYLFTFDLSKVELIDLATNENLISEKLTLFPTTPSPEMVGIERDPEWKEKKVFVGGERKALKYLGKRIEHETKAFKEGSFLPNRKDPDILNPPKSLSPDLKFGCISVRRFYWEAMQAWEEVCRIFRNL